MDPAAAAAAGENKRAAAPSGLPRCPYGTKCYRQNPQHKQDYDHSVDADAVTEAPATAPHCQFGWQCYRKNPAHRAAEYHPPPPKVLPLSPFPLPFEEVYYGDESKGTCQEPRTLRELAMTAFAGAVREKDSWWTKVHDDAIVAKWREEVKAGGQRFTDKGFDYIIGELRWQADERAKSLIQPAGVDGVYMADGLVSAELKAALLAGVRKLEDVPEDKKDWHPGTQQQVLDLVHPSLYCLRLGKSRVTSTPFTLAETLAMFGAGDVKGVAPKELPAAKAADGDAMHDDEEEEEKASATAAAAAAAPRLTPAEQARAEKQRLAKVWGGKRDYSSSAHYAWLPAEFDVSDDRQVRILSYINQLHPVEHAELYPVLERIAEQFLPMWEKVLTDLKNPRPRRIQTDGGWYEPPPEVAVRLAAEKAERKAKRKADAIAAGKTEDDAESYSTEEEEEEEDEDDYDDYFANKTLYQPDVSGAFAPPPALSAEKQVSLTSRRLQVIVKLADISLTPEKPTYAGGSWHVEGMKNERIVASGIYYYHSENISESRLGFRQAVKEPPYEQGDDRGVREVFGLEGEGALNQPAGAVRTQADRLLAFPNILQHQVQPFELIDKSKPGVRKILVFFLVDPAAPVPSTATVPPQQLSWFKGSDSSAFHAALKESTPLIKDLQSIVLDYLLDDIGVLDEAQAKADRELLMSERKYFVGQNNELLFEREFSLCEH